MTEKEKQNRTPPVQVNILDKDSFAQNAYSIFESTKEGSFLAQNIPMSKDFAVSKFNSKHSPGFGTFNVTNRNVGKRNNKQIALSFYFRRKYGLKNYDESRVC